MLLNLSSGSGRRRRGRSHDKRRVPWYLRWCSRGTLSKRQMQGAWGIARVHLNAVYQTSGQVDFVMTDKTGGPAWREIAERLAEALEWYALNSITHMASYANDALQKFREAKEGEKPWNSTVLTSRSYFVKTVVKKKKENLREVLVVMGLIGAKTAIA